MANKYTDEKSIQILMSYMKLYGIRKVIASPGSMNVCFVASVQYDPYFEVYSAVDERSAAYMACGMAEESGEPVVLTCTGATASRNYVPGMTEAFYRKLPVLAVTCSSNFAKAGHNYPQVIDRSVVQKDVAKVSARIPVLHTKEDERHYGAVICNALLELRHNGGGPVHLDMEVNYGTGFSEKELPKVPFTERVLSYEELPKMPNGKIAILVGAHSAWSSELQNAVDIFCEKYNAVVFCDQTSNYRGKYRILSGLLFGQRQYKSYCTEIDVLIYIGNVYGECPFSYQ